MTLISLDVNLEMCDLGFSNPASAETVFYRTQIYLDPSDYDGTSETYYFEVQGYNESGSSKDIALVYWDGDSWETVTTVTIAATTTYTTYRSSSFTPQTGNNKYAVRLPSIANVDYLRINMARIVIKQVGATKTRIQIPLLNSNWANATFNLNDNSYYIVRGLSATWSTSTTYSTKYIKRTSELATISGWSLEVVAAMADAAAGTGYVALMDATGSQRIINSTISITGTTPTLYNVDFSNTEQYFDTNDVCQLEYRGDGTYYNNVQKAALYVELTNLTKCHSYMRYHWQIAAFNTAIVYGRQRVKLESSDFAGDSVAYYNEITGQCADNAPAIKLYDVDSASATSGGSDISDSGVTFNSGTTASTRSSAFTAPTSGHYVLYSRQATTANSSTAACHVVAVLTGSEPPVETDRSSLLQFGIA